MPIDVSSDVLKIVQRVCDKALNVAKAEAARPCIMRMAHSHPENHDASLSAAAAHLALASVS